MANFSREQIRSTLEGAVFPVLTPFTEDGSAVDHAALANYVRFLVDAGAPVVLSTVGTSRFNLLSGDEIKAVNETICEATPDTCMTIAAGPLTGGTAANIKFATHAQKAGADAYIAFFPDRYYGDEHIFDFFKSLSESVDIGVMIHEMPMRSGFYGNPEQYPIELLERLFALPGMVGMKEECMDGDYAAEIYQRLGDKTGIIGAGTKPNFLRDHPHGAKAFLVGMGSFFPGVAIAFHKSLVSGDTARANELVKKYHDPYFDLAVSLGWHVALKETLHLLGLMPAYERDPLPRLSKDKREVLRAKMDELGWLDLDPAHEPQA